MSFLEYTIPLFAAATGWLLLGEPVSGSAVFDLRADVTDALPQLRDTLVE